MRDIDCGRSTCFAADSPEKPSDVGLVERVTKRLAQLDVTVAGPKATAIGGLTGAEFEIRINHKRVSNVIVDDLCVAQPSAREETPPEVAVDAQALGNDSAGEAPSGDGDATSSTSTCRTSPCRGAKTRSLPRARCSRCSSPAANGR